MCSMGGCEILLWGLRIKQRWRPGLRGTMDSICFHHEAAVPSLSASSSLGYEQRIGDILRNFWTVPPPEWPRDLIKFNAFACLYDCF